MRRVVIGDWHSLGDSVEDTIALSWLHASQPEMEIGFSGFASELFYNIPWVTINPNWADAEKIDISMDLIHNCNQNGVQVVYAIVHDLERKLNVQIEPKALQSPITISPDEDSNEWFSERKIPEKYWVVNGGCKQDFPIKGWSYSYFQRVIDLTKDKIAWVQVGKSEHLHRPLTGVVNLINRTSIRDLCKIVYRSSGVLTPISSTLHLATMATKSGGIRPTVVIGGGREPQSFCLYPCHHWFSSIGTLDCCKNGGCWKSTLDTCKHLTSVGGEKVPTCMANITPEEVAKKILELAEI